MADQQHQSGAGGADDPDAPDRTSRFDAVDDRTVADGGGSPAPDATAPLPGGPVPGMTGQPPAAGSGRTAPPPGGPDMTAPLRGGPDITAPLPGGPAGPTAPLARPDATAALPAATEVWSGRAEVKPPTPPALRTAGPVGWEAAGWDVPDERSGRSWWMPILLGLLALLLVGLIGFGVWMFTRPSSSGGVPVVPSRTVAPTTAVASTAPTSPAPTRVSPSATTRSPTVAAPADVVVPELVGLASADARSTLDDLGLTYRLISRTSDQPAGTVIDTDPPAGQEVPAGARVTLVIASAPRTPATPTPAVTPTSPTPTR